MWGGGGGIKLNEVNREGKHWKGIFSGNSPSMQGYILTNSKPIYKRGEPLIAQSGFSAKGLYFLYWLYPAARFDVIMEKRERWIWQATLQLHAWV